MCSSRLIKRVWERAEPQYSIVHIFDTDEFSTYAHPVFRISRFTLASLMDMTTIWNQVAGTCGGESPPTRAAR